VWTPKPLRVGWALFVDGARAWDTLGPARVPLQVDGGVGLRFAAMGRSQLRIDLARGFEDGQVAFSVGWEAH
jgi:hypothetical protein